MALEMGSERIKDDLVRLGKSLVGRFFVLFKTSQNYSEGHQAVELPVATSSRWCGRSRRGTRRRRYG